MSSFKIISFDGGGVKGALSTTILKRLTIKYPNLINETDLFTGVSTGALISLALAYGKDIDFIDSLYNYKNMKAVFSPWHINLFRPKYNNKNLKNILSSIFSEELKLNNLKKFVIIPSFSLNGLNEDHWEAVFFNNLNNKNPISNYSVIDVALSSSAAPTYFPSHKSFVDGGVITNMPSIASILTILKEKPSLKLKDFKLLSIGTGMNRHIIHQNTTKWGLAQWSFNPFTKPKRPLLSMLINDSYPLEELYSTEFLKENFFRINPILDEEIEMDNYKKVNYLKSIGNNFNLDNAYDYIENIFLK